MGLLGKREPTGQAGKQGKNTKRQRPEDMRPGARQGKTRRRRYGILRRWIYSNIAIGLGSLGLVLGIFNIISPEDGDFTRPLFFLLIGAGAAILTLLFLVNMFFIRSIVQPIAQVTEAAHRISEGSYGIQLTKRHNDEVGELTDAVNTMSMRINQTETLKTEFISSVSHELRTPLTAITGWGETLLYDDSLSADNRRGLNIILGEARRLSKLVEELLEFTRMEDGRFTLNIKQIDLAQELEETIFTYREHLRRDGIELGYTPYTGEISPISGDPERLRQVFYNILDNAAKHGRDGGKIIVRMDVEDGYAAVEIRDFGPGIPEDEIDHVKMKFYKGSSKERGSGIGLAVCEEIVRYHDGWVEIENAEDQGLSVTVKLPLE